MAMSLFAFLSLAFLSLSLSPVQQNKTKLAVKPSPFSDAASKKWFEELGKEFQGRLHQVYISSVVAKETTELTFMDTVMTRIPPPVFSKWTVLTRLDLSHCYSLVVLEGLEKLVALKALTLAHCVSLSALPEGLDKLKALEELDLMDCAALKVLPESTGKLKALAAVNLSNCDNLTALPESLGKEQPLLTKISLFNCVSLTELPEFILQLQGENKLDIAGYKDGTLDTLPKSKGLPEGVALAGEGSDPIYGIKPQSTLED